MGSGLRQGEQLEELKVVFWEDITDSILFCICHFAVSHPFMNCKTSCNTWPPLVSSLLP